MASTEKLTAYMDEHILYEIEMLCFTYTQLFNEALQVRARSGTDPDAVRTVNAAYESFAIHARNLDKFIRSQGGSTNRKADEYVKSEPSEKMLKQRNDKFFGNLTNDQVFHMGKDRVGDRRTLVTYDHIADAYVCLSGALTEFGARLTKEFSSSWKPLEALLTSHPPISQKVSIPKSATNAPSFVTTSTQQVHSITPGPWSPGSSGKTKN